MNYAKIIKQALKEDIGRRDITSELLIPADKKAKAVLLAKEDFILCGMDIARLVFKAQDKNIVFSSSCRDGQLIKKGKILARISGKARSILTAERVALNFLSLLSGVATKTRTYVNAVRPYKTKILDTRKTIPGLRELEKYAVRVGGGYNHRMRLDEMVLVKDNHAKVTKDYRRLLRVTQGYKVEIEVNNLKEFKQALKARPDIIMLDNMSLGNIKKAVCLRKNLQPKLEVSGGVTLKNVRQIAATGVDMISIGSLTHSLNSADISLEVIG